MNEKHRRILEGVRVLDMTRVMSGPFCTAMLADLGAEVIKIEMPGSGDEGRHFAPYVDGESVYFALLNRGKKSLTLDLKTREGVEIVKELTRGCDVLVENFRPGVMKRLGLDHEALRETHPGLVYASITGFGADSPFADWPAFDLVIQAMSGLMSITGEREGRATAVGESLGDVCTGMFAAWGIMAALFDRERTGQGRYLDVAMLDSVFSMLITNLSRELYTDQKPRRVGNRHPETYPVDSFPTRDGDIVMVCFSDRAFRALTGAMEMPALAEDPRFATNELRNEHEAELKALISGWTEDREQTHVLGVLRQARVPCAPVWTLGQVLASGHPAARGMVRQGRHQRLGSIPLVPQPVRFEGVEPPAEQVSPMLGQHTDEVITELLGRDPEALAALKEKKVV